MWKEGKIVGKREDSKKEGKIQWERDKKNQLTILNKIGIFRSIVRVYFINNESLLHSSHKFAFTITQYCHTQMRSIKFYYEIERFCSHLCANARRVHTHTIYIQNKEFLLRRTTLVGDKQSTE